MASASFKFMFGLVPATEKLEKQNEALLKEYTELQSFIKSEKLQKYLQLTEFVNSKEFTDKKNYYQNLIFKGSPEATKEQDYLNRKNSADVKFYYKFKGSQNYITYTKVEGSEKLAELEKLKVYVNSEAFKKSESYLKDKKRFEKSQEYQKYLEFKSLSTNQSFKNYFKFIQAKGYSDFKTLYKSQKIAEFETLQKYIQSSEFTSAKSSMKPEEYSNSEANKKHKEYEAILKSVEYKHYSELLKSPLLPDYKKICDSEELSFYNELKTFIESPSYTAKKKEIDSLSFQNSEEYKKFQELKNIENSHEIKVYTKIKNSKELANFLRIENSKIIPDFEELEKQIQSEDFKSRKLYLLDTKKWEKTEEYKQQQELEGLKKDQQVLWYLKIKDSKKFDEFKKWSLVFEDDFTGGNIDKTKWITRYFWGEAILNDTFALPGEKQLFTNEKNIQCNGSSAKILTKREKVTGKEWNPMFGFYPHEFEYTSAIINSGSSFRTKYGKIEAKIKVNPASGIYHAFWLGGDVKVPQIDIFKNVDKKIHLSTFWGDPTVENSIKQDSSSLSSSIVKGKYMIYTLEWTAESIIWKINGEVVKIQTNNIPANELYLSVNSGVFDDNADVSNAAIEIDWVKCYLRN